MVLFNFAHLNSDQTLRADENCQIQNIVTPNDLILSLPKESQGPLALVGRGLKEKLEGELALVLQYLIKLFQTPKLIV